MKKLSILILLFSLSGCVNREIPVYSKCDLPKLPEPNKYIYEKSEDYLLLNRDMSNDQVISVLIHNNNINNDITYKYRLALDYIAEVRRISNSYDNQKRK